MGQKPPGAATTDDVEDSVEDLTRTMDPRSAKGFGDGQMGFYAGPFGVGEVALVCLSHAW